jgi:AcrR family transcriptional regulator
MGAAELQPTQRTYGGATADERRRRRRAALIDATLDVISSDGMKKLGVKEVCARARLNDRYFYESFRDCDEVVLATIDGLAAEAMAAFADTLTRTEPELHTRVRACVETAVDFVTVDPRRGRLLIESQATEALRQRRQQFVVLLAEIMADQGRELLGAAAPSDVDRQLIALTIVSGGLDLAAMWLSGDLDVRRDHFTDFFTAFILASIHMPAALDQSSAGSSTPSG